MARLRGDLCDTRAHDACADDQNRFVLEIDIHRCIALLGGVYSKKRQNLRASYFRSSGQPIGNLTKPTTAPTSMNAQGSRLSMNPRPRLAGLVM